MVTRDDASQSPSKTIDWGKALLAGLIATVVITVTMALFGQNIMKMLGGMIAPNAGAGTQYLLGGAIHLAVGLFYGFLYAWLLGPVRSHGRVVKGALYAAALTGIALAAMPAMSAMMGGGGAANPCNPCNPCGSAEQTGGAMNPCNPCGPGGQAAANPCGPKASAENPCNPCNPCAGPAGGKPGNPCNPCGGAGGPWADLISLANHLFYGLALALVYGQR